DSPDDPARVGVCTLSLHDALPISVERMVDEVKPSVDGHILPAPGAHYIVHAPQGAWPTSCYPAYPVGGGEFMRYVDMCNAGKFEDRKSTRLNSSHVKISYAVFCLT